MVKKVKLTGGRAALDMDEVDQFDDNLSLDGTSQGGETEASQEASDYEDDPKRAPVQLHFGGDRCLKLFQLKKDEESGIIRVCGGPEDCKRTGHKKSSEQGETGVYDTIKTLNYVDGILDTHRTLEAQKAQDARHKIILEEATSQLTGSKEYQERLKTAERELGRATDKTPMEWDDNISEGDLKMPAKESGPTTNGSPRMKSEAKVKTRGSLKPQAKQEGTEVAMTGLVMEVKEALQNMAVCMEHLAKNTQDAGKRAKKANADPGSDESSDEESVPKSLKKGGGKGSDAKTTPGKTKQYYAVARGRVPGVYTKWNEAEKQVNGFSGSMHKKFRDRASAERYVQKNRAKDDSSESSDPSESEAEEASSGEEEPKVRTRKMASKRESKHSSREVKGFPPVELTAPDASVGNSKELFKMTLAGDLQMTDKLSPPGLDRRTKEALADATLDAVQLPGTSLTDVTDSTGDLVGALREMTEDRRNDWGPDRPQKDSLWKAASRTSLLTIKSEEALRERLTEFTGLQEEMFENQVHKFNAIFSRLHWGPETIHAWSCCNWFLRIGKDTLDNYMALHLHLVTLCTNESWTYAHESLKYHASKLSQFRKTSTSRLQCLIKIYIFLRDARKNEFYSPKLQEKRNRAMIAKIAGLETGGGGEPGVTKNGCKKCGLEHSGGVKKCPLKGLSDSEARKRVAKFLGALALMSNEDAAKFLKDNTPEE